MKSISPTGVAVFTAASPSGMPSPARPLACEQQYPVGQSVSVSLAVPSPLIPKLKPGPRKKNKTYKEHKDLIEAAAGLLLVSETAPRALVQGIPSGSAASFGSNSTISTNVTNGIDSLAESGSYTAIRATENNGTCQLFAPDDSCHSHTPAPRPSFNCLLEITELDRKFMLHQPSTNDVNHLPAADVSKKRKTPAKRKGVKKAKKESGGQSKDCKAMMDEMPILSKNDSNVMIKTEPSKPTPSIDATVCKAALEVPTVKTSGCSSNENTISMQGQGVAPSNPKIAPLASTAKKTDTSLHAVNANSIHRKYPLDAVSSMAIAEELKKMREASRGRRKPVSAVSVPVTVEKKHTGSGQVDIPAEGIPKIGILSVAKESKIEGFMSMAIAAELKQLQMTNTSLRNLSSQLAPNPDAVGISSASIKNGMTAENHVHLRNAVVNDGNVQVVNALAVVTAAGDAVAKGSSAPPKSQKPRQDNASKKSVKADASAQVKADAKKFRPDDYASMTDEQKLELNRAYRCASTARHRARKKEQLKDVIKGIDFFRAQLGLPPREPDPKSTSRAGQKRPNYNPPADQMANMTPEEVSEWKRVERLKRKREKTAIALKEENERLLKLTIEHEQLQQMYTNGIAISVKPDKPVSTTEP
ncbi:hypothetical protein ACHAXN_012911 [Cyclotella atomus]